MRIIAGLYKGRELLSPPGSQTRPITGAVKKSLFGMLGEDLSGAVVVDMYSGTGTLGLEALSRGAAMAYFAERDRAVVQRLRRNIQTLGVAARCVVWTGDVSAGLKDWLGQLDRPIDVAFVDPPYAEARNWSWQRVAECIFQPLGERLAADGVVVLRLPKEAQPPEALGGLTVRRIKHYGGEMVALLTL